MIMLCERCCAPIGDWEPVLRLAHVEDALSDGGIRWVHSYVHTRPCVVECAAPHERPDTGSWDPSRGIGGFRP
jgi:hypothetical protein